MNCETEFRTASFAGVPFEILPSEHSGGRRIVTNEYPFVDDHYNEDLGDKPLKWSIKGKFVGDGWRDRLTEAKAKWRKSGAGKFFEPTENTTFDCVLIDWSFSLDSALLNAVEFTLELVEKGLEPYLNLGSSPAQAAATELDRYIAGLSQWYRSRFDLYGSMAEVFRGYDAVRGYLAILTRQFTGIGAFLGLSGTVAAMQPSRVADDNFGKAAAVFEAMAAAPEDKGTRPAEFFRAAAEVRVAGSAEAEDQAHMVAALGLGYYFEAVANAATREGMDDFRLRAEALKGDCDDAAIHRLVDGLLATLGTSAEPACRLTMAGMHHALVASHQLFGDISEAATIMALSGGVSGSAMNGITYPCPA